MIFVSSDHHFYDVNFLKHNYNRYLKYGNDINVINKCMIEAQNNQISEKDIIYYLGDLSTECINVTVDLVKRLNGNIKLITGNHDKFKTFGVVIPNKLEILTNSVYRLSHNKIIFNLFHYPLKEQPDYFDNSIHLHGHTHGTVDKYDERAYDVGFDNNNYKLLPLDFIIKSLNMN